MIESLKVYKAIASCKSCKTCQHVKTNIESHPCIGCHGEENWEISKEIIEELEKMMQYYETIKALDWFEKDYPPAVRRTYILRKYRFTMAKKKGMV